MRVRHGLMISGVVLALGCSDPESGNPGGAIAPSSSREHGDDRVLRLAYGLGDDDDDGGCAGRAYRGFDFWVGDWSITGANGASAGTSRITRETSGCAVMELYQGGSGRSLSRFDRSTGLWHQDYVDATGFSLRLFGGLEEGVMTMADSLRAIPGGPTLASRFTWTPNPDGTVRQRWDFSLDGGATFVPRFNGLYAPLAGYTPPPAPAPGSCATRPAQRAADGFLGTWRVTTSRGRRLGTSTLTLTTGTCLIEEVFRGRDGYQLRSFLYFDRFVGRWYRAQVDSRGQGTRFGGGFQGSDLQLTATVPAHRSGSKTVRLTLVPAGSDAFVQRWEVQDPAGVWQEPVELRWTRVQ